MKLSQFLDQLDILGARPGKDYVGTKSDNPAMVLEEKVQVFTRITDIEDIQESLRIFQEKVCIQGFPARFSPQFWLAHAALSTIYQVLCGHLQAHFDTDLQQQTDQLLFQLWVDLISAGPGSTHLEMMDIVLKNQHFPLWKYMETLQGDRLHQLISTLKTDFVYDEEVSADHYATLMETHIDKIFRTILSVHQFEECRREMLDLYLFYLSRMNHVPPHIGPRLSHLCFLIFNRYPLENPYVGVDDWVLTRNHLRVIKEIITHQNFTVGSEAQYRVPITLEKIFEAAVMDKMLEIMFKDFMTLLLHLCNYGNCRKCKRLFVAYQSGLFEQLDFKKGFEKPPDWLFDQCISAVAQVANLNSLESHLDSFIISTEQLCLLNFSKLSISQVLQWHKLLVNHVVSGRALLVREVGRLLGSAMLQEARVFNWKTHVDSGRMFVDIISDLPWTFIQDDEDSCLTNTVEQYSEFLQQLLAQFRDQEVTGRYADTVNRCVLKCMDHAKAPITLVCLKSDICDFKDANFIREVLFTLDKLFKDLDFSTSSQYLTEATLITLTNCLRFFREKGYIAVDFNSLMMSICVTCTAAADSTPTEDGHSADSRDIAALLYDDVVREFIKLHSERGSLTAVGSLVPQLIQVIQECIQQETSWGKCVDLLSELGNSSVKLLTDHTHSMLELLLDWGCLDVPVLLLRMYSHDALSFVSHFQNIFSKLSEFDVEDRHLVMELLSAMSQDQTQLFTETHISQLLSLYQGESSQTQGHILDIVTNVANKSPSLFTANHYSMLTNTTKFSPLSVRQRAPVLVRLSHHSEELRKQTVEHLIQYTGHKDDAVCLVALETLVPLLKDNPGYVQKHKMKFRNLWKTTGKAEVKDLCAELLPDIRYSGKKPEVKGSPSKTVKVISTPVKTKPVLNKPGSKGREASAMSSKSVLASPRSSSVSSVTVASKPAQVSKDSGDLKQSVKDGERGSDVDKQKLPPIVDNSSDIGRIEKALVSKIKTSPKLEKEESNSISTEKKFVVLDKSSTSEEKDLHGNVTAHGADDMSEKLGGIMKTNLGEENVKTTEISDMSDQDHRSQILTDASPVKPPVCLRVIGVQTIEVFVNTLRNAGYGSYVDVNKGLMEFGDGDVLGDAKAIIYCVMETTPTVTQSIISEIDQLKSQNMPVVVLRMKKFTFTDGQSQWKLLKEKGSIRFYLKPGEQPFKGGNWSQVKFCELLMQLNYFGVLQDEQLVKPDFKNLWKQPKPTSTEEQTQTGHITMTTAMPEVFISYHWGKQNQVEPLFHFLSNHGVRCWMSVYRMSGSESLYNQIVQGIHSCRVMVACVTSNYTHSGNCQQEVTIAQKLNKPIIPVVLGETIWPLEDEFGVRLSKLEPHRSNLTNKKVIDTSAVAMKKLLQKLSNYVSIPGWETQSKEMTPVVDRGDSRAKEKKPDDGNKEIDNYSDGNGKIQETYAKDSNSERKVISSRYAKRSSSMFEIKKPPHHFGGKSPDSDSVVDENDLPPGVAVDDMGYTIKSVRSKSCVIL